MSDNLLHKVDIRNNGSVYTNVYIDDVRISNITGITVTQQSGHQPKIILELLSGADISMFAECDFVTQEVEQLKRKVAKLESENKRLKEFIS